MHVCLSLENCMFLVSADNENPVIQSFLTNQHREYSTKTRQKKGRKFVAHSQSVCTVKSCTPKSWYKLCTNSRTGRSSIPFLTWSESEPMEWPGTSSQKRAWETSATSCREEICRQHLLNAEDGTLGGAICSKTPPEALKRGMTSIKTAPETNPKHKTSALLTPSDKNQEAKIKPALRIESAITCKQTEW